MNPSNPQLTHHELPERPSTAAVLRALNLRPTDPVRTAAAAESIAKLLDWLANGARTIAFWKSGGSWHVNLFDDGEVTKASKIDPLDALNHALTVAIASESLAATNGDRDTGPAEPVTP